MNIDRDRRWGDLLRAANRGDRIAYGRFLAEVAPVLRGLIEARSGRRAGECEDIVQETLIAIHEKRHTWREDAPVAPWLYAIARYKTVDAWRRRAREVTVPLDDEGARVADPAATDPTVARDLDHLLGQIDEKAARIVRDMKLDGFSAEETGARNGMNAGAVRVALHQAMARLQARTGTGNEKDR
jgi:RNA polymerase sigma factor (sigma-70 family)